ncbi:hypothetical protein ACFXPZ_42645 [Streptomyces sp. NPDC059101]|uniref:hypothetical protein n=1 Tax=Streptomyces sp. NPDC059101 TaxID=3346728 RepID=UPI00369F4488
MAEVDSEETGGEDGRAAYVLDGDPATFWHTRWYGGTGPLPHHIVPRESRGPPDEVTKTGLFPTGFNRFRLGGATLSPSTSLFRT